MTKELYVSSTPHETKVGLVEDDLLAEIYLERENEYTLAGSIYKGRVTRVLPGMQSAFVDIGLERDAFLYVSDFMELEDADDVEEVPAQAAGARYQPQARVEAQPVGAETASAVSVSELPAENPGEATFQPAAVAETSSESETRESRGGFRGRRRRRGGRRGERMPESKFARPASEGPQESAREAPRAVPAPRPSRTEHNERSDRGEYGPPPGYQPILLPGESISKYRRQAQSQQEPQRYAEPSAPAQNFEAPLAETPEHFPPKHSAEVGHRFTESVSEGNSATEVNPEHQDENRETLSASAGVAHWDRELHKAEPLQAETTPEPPSPAVVLHEMQEDAEDRRWNEVEPRRAEVPLPLPAPSEQIPPRSATGTLEEEEIEEEEADLASYVEELEEDAAFEELEEETQAAESYRQPVIGEIAASSEPAGEASAPEAASFSVTETPAAEQATATEGEDEAAEVDEEEAELEEAQAEAEALLDAEARGNGTVDAQAEVRAPAGTAAFTQRAPRPAFDRNRGGGQRGRRGGGGRRFRSRENQQVPQITDLLKEGQEILVQIAKEPIGKKGARITSHIALPGRFLVYMPTVNHTGVSRKIASEEERQRLKRIIISERENGHGGFIVRTAAQGASEEELRADIRFLKGLWSEIKTRADGDKSPLLIYHDLNVVERVLRDQVTSDFAAIWVDTEQEYERVVRFANRFQPALVKRVKLYSKETPLYDQFGLNDEINKALKSKVWLKSGGYIVINQTEALVAIDVNTGKYVGKTTRLEDTIVKTNVDAIKEIVRQIRLRDLGGIIIIDFIDMDERRNRQKVMQALEEALRADRAPSKVLQFNDFGLVAITRKRVKQSLERTIGSPCPYCESTGYIKSVTTVCNDIYIEMRKMAKHLDHSDVMLRVNPEVAKALKGNNGRALLEMEELTKKTVIVKSDPALHQEQFDIN
jgi:Rne/Rng family ribonuclease